MTTTANTTGPDYHPRNVTIVQTKRGEVIEYDGTNYVASHDGFTVLDFDGYPYRWLTNHADAVAVQKVRRGVIKAALTRRANKARGQ